MSQETTIGPPTLGEKRVRTTFNPANNGVVDKIKQGTAAMIDLCAAIKNDDSVSEKGSALNPADYQAAFGEKHRLLALAQTAYEEAGMWAVKAATA